MKIDSSSSSPVISATKLQSKDAVNTSSTVVSAAHKEPNPSIGKSNQLRLLMIAKHFSLDKPTSTKTNVRDAIEQRAAKRKRLNAARKQQNLEKIMDFAMEYVDSNHGTEEVDPDWLYQFFQLAETAFSEHMQALWGKILAIQIGRPGTFSLKALNTLQQMTAKEAVALQHACALMCREKGEYGAKIISGYYHSENFFGLFGRPKVNMINLSQFGLSYPDLLTLIDLNLIYGSEIESSRLPKGKSIELDACGQKIILTVQQEGAAIQYYKMTQMGNELARLIKVKYQQSYFQYLAHSLQPVFDLAITR